MKVKSHNHRGWKEPLEIKSNPVLKKVPCSRLHMKAFIWVLNVSVEGDSTVFLGSLFHCCHPHNKEFLLHVCMEIPVFQLLPVALCAIDACH